MILIFRYSMREKIAMIIKLRLEYIIPYINRWPEAMAILADPVNVSTSIKSLALLVDEIAYLSGDRSTDHNWYIQRGVLTGVFTSTELYMLSDRSENFKDTWSFLERRLDDMIKFDQKIDGVVGTGMSYLSMFSGMFSKGGNEDQYDEEFHNEHEEGEDLDEYDTLKHQPGNTDQQPKQTEQPDSKSGNSNKNL
eukprot:TRINITY_DN1233_c0_g1_i2.p1 TRINITY_DN1233_c0_g1~~TRINITY_DN1233_c0_g1_i2.p1  ORF type:complete len:194 (-),score=46.15 TRINITY_DN1233_c0_g1_i2:7-588(-)